MKKLFLFFVALLGLQLLRTPDARAFSWEDPVKSSEWHHQNITLEAANGNFSAEAAASIAWHCDYVDSYLYNPLWWAPGGLGRFKVALATAPELEKVHFDDLFDANKVHYMWRRYASGTMAGLLWAKEKGDVAAAQNIVGVSLHAIQDFYSHSNWIDDPARRGNTLFQIPTEQRPSLALYTGAYEHDEHHGVKHHGKFLYACSIINQPGVKQLLSVACGPGSPLGNSEMCRTYDACQNGTAVRFDVAGVKIPDSVIYQAPPGIALDSTWLSEIGVRQRGLTDISGQEAFKAARGLAVEASKQWLQTLEKNMEKAGAGDFWKRVKSEGSPQANREKQFENYNQFPYTFLSAGPYPPESPGAEEFYLRVRLKTAAEGGAGSDADIYLRADNQDIPNGKQPKTLLDYMPRSNPVLAYNDFEQGDDVAYVAGPFTQLPSSIQLYNHSATSGEVLKELGKTLLSAVTAPFRGIAGVFNTITGKDADWIGVTHKIWSPEQLAAVPTAAQAPGRSITVLGRTIGTPAGQEFALEVNGGEKGHYRVSGFIVKTAESPESGPQGWREFEVRLQNLHCVKESKWDRGSNSDEPFVMALLTPLPGDSQPFRTEPFDDVDSGETRTISHVFQKVRVPKDFGMLNVAINVMEHDDESGSKRDELLQAFAGKVKEESLDENRGLLTAMGAAVGEDWKLEHLEVYAWSRGGIVRTGTVFDSSVNRWIKGRQTASFDLNPAGLRDSAVHTDDLLPYLPPATEPTQEPPPVENPPPVEDPPPTGDTTTGGTTPPGQTPPGGNTPPGGSTTTGGTTSPGTTGGNTPPGNTGNVPGTTGGGTNPNPPGGVIPGTTGGTGTAGGLGSLGGGFKPLEDFDARLDSTKVSREDTLEVLMTFKSKRNERIGFHAGSVTTVITDADGLGFGDVGNLYQPTGDPPPYVLQTLWMEPGAEVQVRYLFKIPKGAVPFRRLSVWQSAEKIQSFDLSAVALPAPVQPGITVSSLVGGSGGFGEFGEFDLRLDGVKKGRNNTLHAFLTYKNMSKIPQRFYSGDMQIIVTGADGLTKKTDGNFYRASGGIEPEYISHTVIVEPQGEAQVRFVFQLPKGSVPQKLAVSSHNDARQEYSLPQIP